jgi:hypothetical protein
VKSDPTRKTRPDGGFPAGRPDGTMCGMNSLVPPGGRAYGTPAEASP